MDHCFIVSVNLGQYYVEVYRCKYKSMLQIVLYVGCIAVFADWSTFKLQCQQELQWLSTYSSLPFHNSFQNPNFCHFFFINLWSIRFLPPFHTICTIRFHSEALVLFVISIFVWAADTSCHTVSAARNVINCTIIIIIISV